MENLEKETPTYERHDVNETPFSVIQEQPSGKCKIAIGMNIISNEEFKTLEEAKEYVYTQPWELIVNVCALITSNMLDKFKESINQKTQENA